MKKYLKDSKGFTVIELLVSTAILGFMVAVMTLSLLQQQRQFNITKETVDIDQTARTLLDFIATEIRNVGARQGKGFSIQLVNGGSIKDEATRCTVDANTSLTGTKDSPPDCITITTWDVARGLLNDPTAPEDTDLNKKPSKVIQPEPPALVAGEILINLPEDWFDDSGDFIGGTINDGGTALIGLRSSSNLCHPNEDIDCLQNPGRCTQCAMIFEADINEGTQQASINNVNDIFAENLPVTFTTVAEIQNGVAIDPADPILYGLIHSITLLPSEISIVKSKTFRLNPQKRELQLSEDGQAFETIAGGEIGTPGGLETPGIIDMQFVFHVQDPDGRISKVGFCDDGLCNDTDGRIFDDFSEDIVVVPGFYGPGGTDEDDLRCCTDREQDTRAVEIFLVVKSKNKAKQLGGNFFRENIRAIGDVDERIAPKGTDTSGQSALKEPEEGFIYRVFSTTVYLRNLATENYG